MPEMTNPEKTTRKRTGRKALVPSTVDGLQSLQVQREVAEALVKADPEAADLFMRRLQRALADVGYTGSNAG